MLDVLLNESFAADRLDGRAEFWKDLCEHFAERHEPDRLISERTVVEVFAVPPRGPAVSIASDEGRHPDVCEFPAARQLGDHRHERV